MKKPKRQGVTELPKVPIKLRRQLDACMFSPELVLFLDIETTGLSHYYDEITILGWSFGGHAKTIVKGQCLDQFYTDIARAKAIVTFNGIRFDVKFIRKEMPDLTLPNIHIDLMYLCRRVGLTGGQKAIEETLGIGVRDDCTKIDGAAAVILWHQYSRGDKDALRTLIRYNRADIAAMGAIFDEAITRLQLPKNLFANDVQFKRWSTPQNWQVLPPIVPPPYFLTEKRSHFANLFGNGSYANFRIVGIDLTGSEKRKSGWCLLEGNDATVNTILSDHAIIEETVRSRPHLVSIDSPLCLPVGRISVDDEDPGRKKYGIMRECERELKRRGVNVYPCLIPSMQKLTARGIRFASVLRGQGIPVIESYPGAAQDIMRIPRKGAGLKWLKTGLLEFGITGDFERKDVTHDELDAITSALVGTFHMAGISEALGTDDEPPLIIPRLANSGLPLVIGVSGHIAAGKTTFARVLERRGFAYTRFSLVIDDLLLQKKQPLTRAERQRLGNEINRSGRQRWLASKTIARVLDAPRIVIDGLRFPDDHAYLVERFGANFFHVHISASEVTRRSRYEKDGQDVNFDEANRAIVESHSDEMRLLAHEVFDNEGKRSKIAQYIDSIIERSLSEETCLFQS